MLNSLSPLDGRYSRFTKPLSPFFSEMGLMRYRLIVEGEYLIALLGNAEVNAEMKKRGSKRGIRKLSEKEKGLIRSLYDLSSADAQIISDIETKGYKSASGRIKATDHDVKAVEYFIKDKLAKTSLNDVLEWVHFALTSEDTNNIAYGLMLKDGLSQVIIPKLEEVFKSLNHLIFKYKGLPILARTHGQSASPTTFGKEFKVFSERLNRRLKHLQITEILCKLNGATGNYNAHVAAFPKVDWLKFSQKFILGLNSLNPKSKILNLKSNLHTTQIEPHDSYVEIFDSLKHINNILIDFNQDMWRYISDEWIVQKPTEGAVGSSTMPHKVNPIKFENSEGNLGIANSMFEFFARKLPVSRLQRDLTDSTVLRNIGTAFAHSLVAYEYLLKGLSAITINEIATEQALTSHPEVIAEAIQTILRREGEKMPYEQLKSLTRGKKVSLEDFQEFIESLNISLEIKKELKKLTPKNYTGLASKLAQVN